MTILFILSMCQIVFSYAWKYDLKGWMVLDDSGNPIKNTWFCDNLKGANDWYVIGEDGYLVTNPLISQKDESGKNHYYFLSQEPATLGKMVVLNGKYGNSYISFNQNNDSYYGEINVNDEGIQILIKEFNIKSYDNLAKSVTYATPPNNNLMLSNVAVGSGGGSGGGGGAGGGGGGGTSHTHNYTWEIIREATPNERGVKLGTCTICGYQKYVYGDYSDEIDEDATRDEIDDYIDDGTGSYTYYIAIDKFTTGADKFIVPPMKVKSNYQMTVAQVLKKVAENKNFTLISNNSFTNGWYLNKIKMDGIGPKTIYKNNIPECLRSHVTTSALTKRTATNILGGQDYTTEAGWMYMVNGVHGSVSMASYDLSDNDVIRIVFSLYGWGADVGSPYGPYYDYAFLTDEIKEVADGNMSLSTLVNKAKKLVEE